ncbi:hypothetical protein TWF788_002996 [Orbilia oligospora]|uniref:Uncharacterized protein n=2 Tax=Orbilia oligospora TaxID=2813651 RepID=A0A7C8UT30_ORBOL|nr:hypothetical protein TWF788_002996 [Orbilia oligospora]KAF3212554.1 hypothetical protein TWF679_005745 [Orbilia oligospora]KAF3213675.1 hypothetical protein TWF191_009974 [Orbilia oligospora]
MPFEARDDNVDPDAIGNHYHDDGLLWQTHYAAVEVFDYPHATMHMKIFCQSYWGELHDLTFSYKRGSTKEPEEENAWETKFRQSLARPGTDEAAMMHTPLAAVVRYDTGNPTTHLFYISTGFKIREVIWKNGSQTNDCLGITVCPTSSLAVTKWGAGSQTHFRLYYQSKAGTIEEHCLDCNAGTWTKGATLSGPVSACDDDSPLRGTSLSFINLAQDKPELRGYFQTAKGSIQEFTYKGTKWSTSKIGVDAAPFRTPLAAITVEKNKIAALYYVDAYNRVNEVLWEGDWEGSERIDGESVAPGARLAVASLKYIGHDKIHMFSSGLVNVITQRVWTRENGTWGDRPTIVDFEAPVQVEVEPGLDPAIHLTKPTRDGRRV